LQPQKSKIGGADLAPPILTIDKIIFTFAYLYATIGVILTPKSIQKKRFFIN